DSARPLLTPGAAFFALAALACGLQRRGLAGERWEDGLAAVTLVLTARALYLWLRPVSDRIRQSADERRIARRLVRSHGDDSLAFFSLRRGNKQLFSPPPRGSLSCKGGARAARPRRRA